MYASQQWINLPYIGLRLSKKYQLSDGDAGIYITEVELNRTDDRKLLMKDKQFWHPKGAKKKYYKYQSAHHLW